VADELLLDQASGELDKTTSGGNERKVIRKIRTRVRRWPGRWIFVLGRNLGQRSLLIECGGNGRGRGNLRGIWGVRQLRRELLWVELFSCIARSFPGDGRLRRERAVGFAGNPFCPWGGV
jgi:hypothetical protein